MFSSPDSMLVLRVVLLPELPTPHGKFLLSVCPCSQHLPLPAPVFPAHTQHPYLPISALGFPFCFSPPHTGNTSKPLLGSVYTSQTSPMHSLLQKPLFLLVCASHMDVTFGQLHSSGWQSPSYTPRVQ